MTNPYLDRCKEIAADIDIDQLSSQPLGNVVGKGSGFTFRQQGILQPRALAEEELYAGVKLPIRDRRDTEYRIDKELGFIGMLSMQSPELMSQVPSFMNLIVVEDSDATGILTEDASAGGQFTVRRKPASAAVRNLLRESFAGTEVIGEVIREGECATTLAFDVGGRERLLDFTPLPVETSQLLHLPAYRQAKRDTFDQMSELTISVPNDSPLGRSMQGL